MRDDDDDTLTREEYDSFPRPKKRLGLFVGLGILAVVAAPFWFFVFGPRMRHERLEKHGIRAPGRLLDVEETGTEVNDSPELELTVEFRRADGRLDTAKTDFVPSLRSIHLFQSGVAVTAAYDSTDPHEITVVDISTGPPTGMIDGSTPAPASLGVVDSLRRAADSLQQELLKAQEKARGR